MDAAAFRAQSDEAGPSRWIRAAAAQDVLGIWNEAFTMPYFDYRAGFRSSPPRRTRGPAPTPSRSASTTSARTPSYREWWRSTDDEIVVTVDDDDFFQPDLGLLAKEFVDGIDLVLWPQTILRCVDGGTLDFRWAPMPITLETNWAIRASFLKANFSPQDGRQMLAHHPLANELIADRLGIGRERLALSRFRILEHPAVRFIEPSFGLYNAHVGSISFLIEALKQPDPAAYLRSLDLTLPATPPYIAALEPYLKRLAELWSSISRA